VPQIPWLFPPGVFGDVVSVWVKAFGPSPGAGGELTETWATLAEDWPRAKVVPMNEADQLELAAGYREADYFVYLVAADDGSLPEPLRDDRITWTDPRGRPRTFHVHYSVDEGEMGVCQRAVCSELRVQ
jgi:hypothetical protein